MSFFSFSSKVVLISAFLLSVTPGVCQTPRPWEPANAHPDRVALCVTESPSTSQSVTWRTDNSVTEAFAEIAVANGSPAFHIWASRVNATTEALDLSQVDANLDQVAHYHTARFENLRPDTLYAYRVGSRESRTEWFQFRTASAEPEPFSFVYVGDAQNGVLSHWSRLIRTAYSRDPEIGLMIHAGDLVNNGNRDTEWGEWFKGLGWISAQIPMIAVPGNHEYRDLNGENQLAIHWRKQFEFPRVDQVASEVQETVFATDYQGARLIALNSLREVEAQARWLESVLEDNPNPWTIAIFHHPVFASAVDRDNLELRRAWKPVFDKYGVDLVLQGHDHTYGRGMVGHDASSGTVRSVYVNSVSGSKMYALKPDRWAGYAGDGATMRRSAENTQLFQWIRVEADRLTYEARMATGELYDGFTLIKGDDGSNRIEENSVVETPERTMLNTLIAP